MNQITRIDPAALNRALIGFDRIFNDFEHRFSAQLNGNYPPHNVIKTGDTTYEIQVAVSGFEKHEVTVEVDQNQLIIKGESMTTAYPPEQYLHRGLATRDFVKSLQLAEFIEVTGANIKNGILSVYLEKIVPESLKPRQIPIKGE